MKSHSNTQTRFQFLWLAIFPILLLISFYFSWVFLSTQAFLYEFWYDNTKLESFIDFYAPQNNSKPEFALTSREERIRVFSEIVDSINDSGKGLAELQFKSPSGKFLGSLLNRAEVEHLQLVAGLVHTFKTVALFSLPVLVIFFICALIKNIKMPDIKNVIYSYLSILCLLIIAILLIGPEKTFVFLHKQFFPANHQWFFYYQDSLMTTLMMAPDLFAYFTLAWCGLAIFIFVVLVFFLKKLASIFDMLASI